MKVASEAAPPILLAAMRFLLAAPCFLAVVRDWGAFRAGLYAFISPIIAVAVGVAYADEPFGWAEGLSMGIMLAATALSLSEKNAASG